FDRPNRYILWPTARLLQRRCKADSARDRQQMKVARVMRQVLAGLALGAWRSSWMPVSIKRIVSYALAGSAWRQAKWIEENPFNAEADEWIAPGSQLPVLGIVKENWGLHWHYIAACRELGVSYRLIDLS